MNKTTDELTTEIKGTSDIEVYIRENTGAFNDEPFVRALKERCAASGLTQEAIANRAVLSHSYVNNMLNSAKRPGRDTVIKLSFGLGLGVDDTNRLLKLAGHGELYPRLERDAVLLFCLNKGVGLTEVNLLLERRDEKLLSNKE